MSILNLNDDELIKIFEFLDKYTISDAFETCERFYNVISSNESFFKLKHEEKLFRQISVHTFIKNPKKYQHDRSFIYDLLRYYGRDEIKIFGNKLLQYKNNFEIVEMNYFDERTKFFVSKMNVKKLSIIINLGQFSFNTMDPVDNFKPNYSIQELTLNIGYSYRISKYNELLRSCKEVRKLTFLSDYCKNERSQSNFSHKTLEIIANNMPKLISLEIGKPCFYYHSMKFGNIRYLKLAEVNSTDEHRAWISLALCCPNLRKVEVNQIEWSPFNKKFTIPWENLKQLLNTCQKFQSLIIGPFFDISDEFVQTILNFESKKLLYLQIKSHNPREDLERIKIFENSRVKCEIVPIERDPEMYMKENFFV